MRAIAFALLYIGATIELSAYVAGDNPMRQRVKYTIGIAQGFFAAFAIVFAIVGW